MARTKAEAGKKAGGKASRKAPALRTTPAVKSGSVSKVTKRKGSAGARNSACKRPVPKWQMPIGEFLTKAGSSKEAAAGAPPKEGEVGMEVVEVDTPTTVAASGNADSTVKDADTTIVEEEGADNSTVEEEGADNSTTEEDGATSTMEEEGADSSTVEEEDADTVEEKDADTSGTKDGAADTSTMEDAAADTSTMEEEAADTSTMEDDGDTSIVKDEADDTSVVKGGADSSMVADETEKSMNGDKASGDEDLKNEGSAENGNVKKNVQENEGKPEKEEGEVSEMDESSSDIEVVDEMPPKEAKAVTEVPKISHDELKEDQV